MLNLEKLYGEIDKIGCLRWAGEEDILLWPVVSGMYGLMLSFIPDDGLKFTRAQIRSPWGLWVGSFDVKSASIEGKSLLLETPQGTLVEFPLYPYKENRDNRIWWKAQIVELEELARLVEDHPIMSQNIKGHIEMIKEELKRMEDKKQ